MRSTPKLRQGLAALLAVSFAILPWVGIAIHPKAPPGAMVTGRGVRHAGAAPARSLVTDRRGLGRITRFSVRGQPLTALDME